MGVCGGSRLGNYHRRLAAGIQIVERVEVRSRPTESAASRLIARASPLYPVGRVGEDAPNCRAEKRGRAAAKPPLLYGVGGARRQDDPGRRAEEQDRRWPALSSWGFLRTGRL